VRVVSHCPLRVAQLPWRSRAGAAALTVICKATFDLLPGESRLAAEQEQPCDEERHWGDDPERSLYAPSDAVPFKPRAEVLLVGHAFAPHGERVSSLIARLALGAIDKSITVVGDRAWTAEGSVGEVQPFARMPLRYERAAGGPESDNPVGLRLEGPGPLPNLKPPGAVLRRRGDRIAPIAFGPIAARWPGRAGKLGPSGRDWLRGGWQERTVPEDLDASFFNAAPPDQQLDHLAPDADLVLEQLDAQHPVLVTSLPGIRPRAFVERADEGLGELALTADTLWIDSDRSIGTLVWRGQLALRNPGETGRIHVLLEEPGKPLSWSEIERACVGRAPALTSPDIVELGPAAPPRRDELEITGRIDLSALSEDLPFLASTATDLPPGVDASPPWLAPPSVAPPRHAPQALLYAPEEAAPPEPALVVPSAPAPEPPVSVLSASNAATSAPRSAPIVEPARVIAEAPAPAPIEVIELLWFDPAMIGAIRENPPWRELLALLAPRPPEIRYDDEAPPPEEPEEVKARREVFSVITEAEPAGEAGLDDRLARAVGPMGAFEPPLALVAGELHFPFDELATLEATLAAVSPLAAGDKKIKEMVETVNELLKTPWLQGSSGVAEGLTARVKEAFAQSGRLLPPGYLDAHTERRLLEQRHYQRRTLLGQRWIRCTLTPIGASLPIPTYLPDELATRLPMFTRMKARLLVELHLQQDQYEAHPHALRAVALARVAPAGRAKR
jgi:hypothetical protein